jgi:tetratricopeptide (TPR) repeat protein
MGVTFSTGPQKANAPVRGVVSSSTAQTLDPAIAPFLEMLGRGQWDQALATIDALAARTPQNKRYAALAAYARGRRAQVEGNMRDAQIELNQALMIDPELELARIAVAEMYKARK